MGLLWAELLLFQTLLGYCFVVANACIGIYNIKDLNNMKGDLVIVKYHKRIGWTETFLFYTIAIQCMIMVVMSWGEYNNYFNPFNTTKNWHAVIGGIVGAILFTFKFYIARHKKNGIYKYGQFIGPIGFLGWSLAHWTSVINFYFGISPDTTLIYIIPSNFIIAAILPIPIGIAIFLFVLVRRGSNEGSSKWSVHQIAFILHGITFGYEKAAKELLGTPAMFKYVVPKTYKFLEKMMEDVIGVNLENFKELDVSTALKRFSEHAKKIGMAEKIKINWKSDSEVVVESINCSTAKVRSVMDPEELEYAICPWAIMAAAIVNQSTGKELTIEPSTFNEIGASTKIILK